MPASIGVNLRVTGNCRQGGRKYMEDFFSVAYQQTEDEKDLEYAFFGIFDGHGGAEAAAFAKEHLMETIIKHKNFWSENDDEVLRAIKDGYIATHYAMWREQSKWPKTSSGLPSTAGTTASIAFIRRGKIYIGHVGDSGIVLGYQEPGSLEWRAKPLTKDHKPENPEEMKRIEMYGGKVVSKSGVPRVVWNRPRIGHQGPVRRSTPIDEIPFLAVARSLGDLWSYNSQINQFIVSPNPDCSVIPIDANIHRCLIFGTDGLFNMLSPALAVHIVQNAERHNECSALSDSVNKVWLNPSKLLVQRALERWMATKMRADNTSVVTLMLDPPGPPRAQVLKDRKKNLPESGLKIMTRYDESGSQNSTDVSLDQSVQNSPIPLPTPDISELVAFREPLDINEIEDIGKEEDNIEGQSSEYCDKTNLNQSNSNNSISSSDISSNFPLKEKNDRHYLTKLRESISLDPRESLKENFEGSSSEKENLVDDNTIQINEISSSNIEESSLAEETNNSETEVCRKSMSQSKKGADGDKKKAIKRKSESDEHLQRKSVRLSINPKGISGDTKVTAPVSVTKTKSVSEKTKKNKIDKKNSSKISIAKTISKDKRLHSKRKNILKDTLSKKKIKLALETVISKTSKMKPSVKNTAKIEKKDKLSKAAKMVTEKGNVTKKVGRPRKLDSKVKKASKKVISGKLSKFKGQHVKNSVRTKDGNTKSKALKHVIVNSNKNVSDKKLQGQSDNIKWVKHPTKGKSKKEVLMENKSKKNVKNPKSESPNKKGRTNSSKATLSCGKSVPKVSNAKENITPKDKQGSSSKKTDKKEKIKKNTLRQRIQDKTKIIKKTVLRK